MRHRRRLAQRERQRPAAVASRPVQRQRQQRRQHQLAEMASRREGPSLCRLPNLLRVLQRRACRRVRWKGRARWRWLGSSKPSWRLRIRKARVGRGGGGADITPVEKLFVAHIEFANRIDCSAAQRDGASRCSYLRSPLIALERLDDLGWRTDCDGVVWDIASHCSTRRNRASSANLDAGEDADAASYPAVAADGDGQRSLETSLTLWQRRRVSSAVDRDAERMRGQWSGRIYRS